MSVELDPVDSLIARAQARVDPKLHAHGAPAGYRLRGVSTMLDAEGVPKLTWIKTAKEVEDALAVFEEFKALVKDAPIPRASTTAAPTSTPLRTDLMTVYPMGDPHFGLMSWPEETGHDSTLQIARDNLIAATDRLVTVAPDSEHALLINLGDFLHADNLEARTARSGHALDVDSRWPKVLRVAVWTLISLVKRALQKHARVTLWCIKGNHDDHSAVMLAICLAAHFADEPRVTISESPAMFEYLEWGKVLIGGTHGHTIKMDALESIMATDQAAAWGRTKFRYFYTGHVHHSQVKEYRGVIAESFRTLAARDAWHAGQGYRAGRSMDCIVLHSERGEIARHRVGVEEL
jgi:predicted phosphodiesterase